jgi:hypothetical protein
MDFKQVDALASQDPALPYLVIGGYAVIAHGFVRTTVDIDLLICRDGQKTLEKRAKAKGFEIFFQTNTFIQFTHKGDHIGLDLMMVAKPSFDSMYEAAL